MHPNLADNYIVLDSFETFNGYIYKLMKMADNRFQVRRNYTIFVITTDYELAADEFYKIKDLLKRDQQVRI